MARFHGKVGYAQTTETAPGVYRETFVERSYFGEVDQNRRTFHTGDRVNADVSLGNSIRIVADDYANGHFFAIRYVEWAGVLWTVRDVEVQHPRLHLHLGEVYHGDTPRAPDAP